MRAAAPFLLLWARAPVVAYWLSVPVGARVRPLSRRRTAAAAPDRAQDLAVLRDVRDREADGWLPPDNYQEDGDSPELARRTSPTNIGMGLLSTLAAHDLGYSDHATLVERLDATLTTLEGLERYEGHFLNWYDTADAGAAAPAVRLDRGQRQPGGGARSRSRQGLQALVDRAANAARSCSTDSTDTADLLAAASSLERRASGRPAQTRRRRSTASRARISPKSPP